MKYPLATQIVSADQSWLSLSGNRLHVPGAGRTVDNAVGGYLEIVIYSITLAVDGAPSTGTYGFTVLGNRLDSAPMFTAYDTVSSGEAASIHITFPNGLPCRQIRDVGTLHSAPANVAGVSVLGAQKEMGSNATSVDLDLNYCPAIDLVFADTPASYTLTVTYGYVHQAELRP